MQFYGSLLSCDIISAKQEKEGKSTVIFLPQRPGWAIWQSLNLGARLNNMLWVTFKMYYSREMLF
jgi:hypothetical protein